jgi:hypothetical protein
MPLNGDDDSNKALLSLLERLAATLSRLRTAVSSLSDGVLEVKSSLLEQGSRREREYERLREGQEAIRRELVAIAGDLDDTKQGVEKVREETNPRIRLPAPADKDEVEQREKSGLLVLAARVAEKVPTPWVGWLLKLALSGSAGALAMRALQWLANGR